MASNKEFDNAIKDNVEDFYNKIYHAAKRATKDAMVDINTHALSCLQDYYDEYDPYRTGAYRNTDSLRHAILPTHRVVDEGDHIVCEAGVEFDAHALDVYVAGNPAYDASNKYTIVDADWVIENYLRGVHPRTNGARVPDEVEYTPMTFSPSPDEKMKKQIEDYQEKFQSNLYKYFVK